MDERELAETRVKPKLVQMGFQRDLISGYGTVPIKFGTTTVYADYVCYYMQGDDRIPYLVVEVKAKEEGFDYTQPESYAQRLGAPFFVETDSEQWHWYLTGRTQGQSIRLSGEIRLPEMTNVAFAVASIRRNQKLIDHIKRFEEELVVCDRNCRQTHPTEWQNWRKSGCNFDCDDFPGCILGDTIWHEVATKELRKAMGPPTLQNKTSDDLKGIYFDWTMGSRRPVNIDLTMNAIEKDLDKVKESLRYLQDEKLPIEERFDALVSSGSQYHIPGMGSLKVTELLAAVDSTKYVVLEYNVLQALKNLGVTDLVPQLRTGKDYMYYNNICKDLFGLFKNQFNFSLTIVHNFLWHYYRSYINTGDWMSF